LSDLEREPLDHGWSAAPTIVKKHVYAVMSHTAIIAYELLWDGRDYRGAGDVVKKVSQAKIAEAAGCKQPAVSKAIALIERAGLIKKTSPGWSKPGGKRMTAEYKLWVPKPVGKELPDDARKANVESNTDAVMHARWVFQNERNSVRKAWADRNPVAEKERLRAVARSRPRIDFDPEVDLK
jgi:hypothetical protein